MKPRTKPSSKTERNQAKLKLKLAFLSYLSIHSERINTLTVKELTRLATIHRATFYDSFENIPDFIKWFLHSDLIFQREEEPLTIEVAFERIFTFIDHYRMPLQTLLRSVYKQTVVDFIHQEAFTYQLSNIHKIDQHHLFTETEKRFIISFYTSGMVSITIDYIQAVDVNDDTKRFYLMMTTLIIKNYIEDMMLKKRGIYLQDMGL